MIERGGEGVTVTHASTAWAILEHDEGAFECIVWMPASTEAEPREADVLRWLARTRPALARATYFVVDDARRARIVRQTPAIAWRFIGSDADLERALGVSSSS